MRQRDRERFAQCMTALCETYGKPVSEVGLKLWWQLLDPYEIDAVERATRMHMLDVERGRFMPMPADIVRLIEGAAGDRASVAFAKLRTAIGSVGPYRSVAFDDSLIHACVEHLGGWIKVCDWASEEIPFRQKEFVAHYQALAVNREVPAYSPVLRGEHDLANRSTYPDAVKPPVLIGEAAGAMQVMRLGRERAAAVTDLSRIDVRSILKIESKGAQA